jgi:WG containing repeat
VTAVVAKRTALACALVVSATFAGPARADASQAANADYSCTYSSKAKSDVVQVDHCASADAAGHIHLKRQHLRALDFDRQGLASVYIGGGWRYFSRDGRSAPVMTMDNGADSFADGLARSPVGAKVGFIDRNLTLVIPPRYNGALPFENGSAAVCVDCKLTSEGEHSSYDGGRWTCIDRHGHERQPFNAGPGAGHVCRP